MTQQVIRRENSGSFVQNEDRTLETVRRNYGPKENRRIMKNLILIGIPFLLLFCSYSSVSNLQSSLYGKNGLGPYSLATIYIVSCTSSLFFLSIILSKVTSKTGMVAAMAGYITYIMAQFYPTFATLIPAAALLGISSGVIWTSMSNYVSQISSEYSYITGENMGVVLARFFGIVFLLFQTSTIWGNVILTSIFAIAGTTSGAAINDTTGTFCGANFCPTSASHGNYSNSPAVSNMPPQSTLNLTFGFYFGCMLLAAIIMNFCVDPLSRYGEGCSDVGQSRPSVKDLLLATFTQMKNPYQLLLIPFIFFSTFQTGFFATDFTAGYITCALGIEHIGKVMICFGLAATTSSLIFSRLIKYTGRLIVFLIIILIHLTADLIMLKWTPTSSQPIGFYLISCLYGIVEGVLAPQITAFLALFFPDSRGAAFNNNRLWQGLGYITAYINATAFCMESKLYWMMGVAIFSFIGYAIVEILYSNKCKEEKSKASSTG